MPQPHEHAVNRNFIESILRYVPGFRGYLEKEYRRESDALQREWIADRLQRAKRGLDGMSRALVDAGNIDPLPRIDRLRGRLDAFLGRVRGAMHGYSGFFDLVRIREAELERVYEHDLALTQRVNSLGETIERLPERQGELAAGLTQIEEELDALHRHWDDREDILKGLK